MCGIAGQLSTQNSALPRLQLALNGLNDIQRHRGPDGEGVWQEQRRRVGLAHVRLSVIDLTESAAQPMVSNTGNVVTFNGEIYNYLELRQELGLSGFQSTSDTEVILKAYERWGEQCVERLRGMFAFAIWDEKKQQLFVARDRFGIKPFYYHMDEERFTFASEMKALVPFMASCKTDSSGLHNYFSFQFCLGNKTMFAGIHQLEPGHCGYVTLGGEIKLRQYWEVYYNLDWNHTETYFVERTRELLKDSVSVHTRADVEVGAYVSGGIDSSLIAALARQQRSSDGFHAFNGRFTHSAAFDESQYAQALADENGMQLHIADISEQDFVDNINNVIYHLDQPVAGPGSFPQFMVSKLVKNHLKVVLGGQGGDEIFGGYARYLLAYFEQCLKGALDGTANSKNFVVTYESIIPNLTTLKQYQPLMQEFWAQGIFDERDRRYFRLVNRANNFGDVVNWELFDREASFADFQKVYWGSNVGKESYFDSMTHFDFKTLLPALLQVEDRMSMAHGIESRVPLIDHPLVELAATMPADVKFKDGELKRLLRNAFTEELPESIVNRKDKMGFPVPLNHWLQSDGIAREFVLDTFSSESAKNRSYLAPGFDSSKIISRESVYGRNAWALLSLELWQQNFHDQHAALKAKYDPA